MKKTVFLLAILSALVLAPAGFGQVYFHEDFQNAVLDNRATADVDSLWTLYSDNNVPVEELAFLDKAWKIYGDADGDRFAVSPSYFKGSEGADRWLVTPAIALTDATNPVLVFRAKSLDSKNRDNVEVRISTTDSTKASFAKTLHTVNRAQFSWNYYTVDLSEYKGQRIFLAFVQNSDNRYAIGLDGIFVYEKSENQIFAGSVAAPVAAIARTFPHTLSVKAELYNAGNRSVSSCTLSYSLDGGEKRSITVNEGIEPGATHRLSFGVPVEEQGYHTVEISMENAPATQITSFIALHTALPQQCLMWEAFSSGMCVNCEPWNRVLHPVYAKLKTNVPDNSGNFVMAKYQVDIPMKGDPMVTAETLDRAQYYNINAAPSFYMNGRKYQPDNEIYEQALRDSIAAFRTRTSNLRLNARLTREENAFRVESSVTTCFPDPDNYELVVVLMEDSIHLTTKLYNGEQDFFSIVRKMMSPCSGQTLTPARVGDSVKQSFSFVFQTDEPRIFNGLDGVNAVAYLQNARTRQITQALYLKAGYPTTNDNTAHLPAGQPAADCAAKAVSAHFDLYPNPADEKVNLRWESGKNQSLDVRVFSLAGAQKHAFGWNVTPGTNHTEINTSGWNAGTYLVGIYSPEGVIVKKLIIK